MNKHTTARHISPHSVTLTPTRIQPWLRPASKVMVGLLSIVMTNAYANTLSLIDIQHQWAKCQYQTPDNDKQQACFETLIQQNESAFAAHPKDLNYQVWLGINESSYAGAKGGIGALSWVKKAKANFEHVIALAPNTFHGSAYTSLGTLYFKVPGWPVAFGDNDKAEALLKKGLAINPNGLDSNFFYADYLIETDRRLEGIEYLQKALQAPVNPSRPIAEQGRRADIKKRLESLGIK